jgi:hypothetical protein
METKNIILLIILIAFAMFYLTYTLIYSFVFIKNKYFSGRKKIIHFILIWAIPFLWILLIKSFLKPVPGSAEFHNKKDSESYKENFGPATWWLGSNNANNDK